MIKRICVIGSSYIGAVYTAYKVYGSEDDKFQIDFFGHSHGGFSNVKIVNGHVRNVRFKSPGTSVDVREYDAFVVYGDLPAPQDLAKRVNHCVQTSASQQLTQTLVADIVRSTTAYSLADALLQVTGKPVLMLSRNVVLISKTKMKEAQNAYVISLFETALHPHKYLPFPREIFDEQYLPNEQYYRGSINLTGDKAEEDTGHDNHHMNEQGGLLILEAILGRLGRSKSGATR